MKRTKKKNMLQKESKEMAFWARLRGANAGWDLWNKIMEWFNT